MDAAPVCVYCREQPVSERWRPFCSERCRLLDLARWLDGGYRVPATDTADADRPPDAQADGDPDPHEAPHE